MEWKFERLIARLAKQSAIAPAAVLALALALVMPLILLATAGTLNAQDSVLSELKAQFNKDRGSLRLVVLVSPTCPECVGGAGWIQDYVLKRYPNLPIKTYAIWYEMYPGDSPDDFPTARKLMPDRRVTHWWDQQKTVGRWFYDVVPTNVKGEIQWDAYFLYGEDATWTEQQPAPLLTWGRTILNDRKKLTEKIAELVGPPTVPVIELRPPTSGK